MSGGGGAPGSGSNSNGYGHGWVEKKSKKSENSVGKGQRAPCTSSNTSHAPNRVWQVRNGNGSGSVQHSDRRPATRCISRSLPQNKHTQRKQKEPVSVVTAPPANGLQWVPRSSSSVSDSNKDDAPTSSCDPKMENGEDDNAYDDDSDNVYDDDDDSDDDMVDDTESTEKNFEIRKRHELLKSIFELLENLSVEQINDKSRHWHCPACKNVRGGVAWYKGLQPLMNHARTKGSKRVKLHRELAALLEEELYRMGVSMAPSGEFFGIWKGLRENTDRRIVWPPVVIVMNTRLEQDEDGKWKGMGNQELRGYFINYHVKEACHAYGPDGHSGMSALIFEGSAVAYKEAERLHNHFVGQRMDRNAWLNLRVVVPGGKKQLYGFLAEKEDMEEFNRSHEKDYLKYEMTSYNEMVVTRLKQMSEDNQQLNYVKNELVKTKQHSKEVEKALGAETQKLQEAIEDSIILKRKTNELFLECEEQMKFHAKFYHDQIEGLRKDTEQKESEFERLLQEELAQAIECDVDYETAQNTENCRLSEEQIQRIVDCQVKDVKEFGAEQDELIKAHEEKKAKVKKEYMEKDFELEEELYAALTSLMEKHKPDSFQSSSS
ncbi:protein SUPPRESSOR OF GENE SILENCING 3 homolog [Oryza brachyantha]|uniref:protein SUPPRESSOR OF GENE SILENCING 3 homolog n=1 Tax=Oryza brachyantha TaxID=4533 RepID=UPI0003EA96F8|nr:protein SUPPRESSOR OF GENE SILENCING 3 homolog [Oryza brachyantha]